ncbi:MAG: NADH-quinone oxidoreductase subunit NuoE [Dehalococcoidales bacterium]|nr:NADH-quinone oxidoreductase subunit NuoE [Dehalococcoidales bacterium]
MDYNPIISCRNAIQLTLVPVTNKSREQLGKILSSYGADMGSLLPILEAVQRRFGYLPEEAMEEVARFLGIANSTVYSVATFYSHFRLAPIGKRIIRVCRGTACHVRGVAGILDELEKRLSIRPGETTADGEYTLETIACFGSCALAPVMVINDRVYGRLTTGKIGQILEGHRD